uniref:Uncharacterized protein n=1 Tax=Ignisphaera aggregans TaxID=334771 RepID=A0A7C5XLD1_9CREN
MPKLIYCPFIGCCPLRVVAYTNSIANKLIHKHIIPFMKEKFSIQISYTKLVNDLFQSIDEYCSREIEKARKILRNIGVDVVKACEVLPKINRIIKMNRYIYTTISLKKIPVICSDKLPEGNVYYKVNYRFSEAASRTLLAYTALYVIYKLKEIDMHIDGEQIIDLFSKQLSNTWRSKMRLKPIVVEDIEIYLDWNKQSFIAKLKELLINIANET